MNMRMTRRLTAADWRLLLVVALAQLFVAGALRGLGISAVRSATTRFRRLAAMAACGSEEQIVWAILATGRRLRWVSTCLVRALVADVVLGSSTRPVSVTIGVRWGPSGSLESHAWVAHGGRVVLGATASDFTPILEWNTPSA
jgi:transglutaminase superfamily protein